MKNILVIAEAIRNKIYNHRLQYFKKNLREKIIKYYASLPAIQITNEQKEVIDYLKKEYISVLPYIFKNYIPPDSIEVFNDDIFGLKYVIFEGKRLFFKKSWSVDCIKSYYSGILLEQDNNSPHRYIHDDFYVNDHDVVVDAGAAEGNFSLSVVEKASKLYLFEKDKEWIEVLQATFSPWKNKVHIINKCVSDKNDKKNITLDSFFTKEDTVNFIKIDVDGYEYEIINGSERILTYQYPLKIAMCTYHKQNDEIYLFNLLKRKKFDISFTKRYMIYYFDFHIEPPYLRRGILRACKTL